MAIAMVGCKKDKDHTYPVLDGAKINIWQDPTLAARETNGAFKEIIIKQRIPGAPDSLYNFSIKALFSKAGVATEDIPVNFALDYSTLDSINYNRVTSGLAAYEKAPDSIFTFSNKSATITSGNYSSEERTFSISSKKMPLGHTYIIPIRASSSKFGSNTTGGIAYFVIKGIDPYPWTIAGFDSQETNGEGPNNGRAIFLIDKDINTFWHSKRQGGNDPMPHWVSVDMNRQVEVKGLTIVNRQNSDGGQPTAINVDVSKDGKSWTPAGSFNTLKAGNAPQTVTFASPQTCRYFKVTVTANTGMVEFCYLAEVGIF